MLWWRQDEELILGYHTVKFIKNNLIQIRLALPMQANKQLTHL